MGTYAFFFILPFHFVVVPLILLSQHLSKQSAMLGVIARVEQGKATEAAYPPQPDK